VLLFISLANVVKEGKCKPRAPCMVTWIIRQPISPPLHVYKLRLRISRWKTLHLTIHLTSHFVSCSPLLTVSYCDMRNMCVLSSSLLHALHYPLFRCLGNSDPFYRPFQLPKECSQRRELRRNITASKGAVIFVIDGAAVPTLRVAHIIFIVVVPWR
jgi:hypothetical protein